MRASPPECPGCPGGISCQRSSWPTWRRRLRERRGLGGRSARSRWIPVRADDLCVGLDPFPQLSSDSLRPAECLPGGWSATHRSSILACRLHLLLAQPGPFGSRCRGCPRSGPGAQCRPAATAARSARRPTHRQRGPGSVTHASVARVRRHEARESAHWLREPRPQSWHRPSRNRSRSSRRYRKPPRLPSLAAGITPSRAHLRIASMCTPK
jgi:hypothetical protein